MNSLKKWLIKVFFVYEMVNKCWNEIPFSGKKTLSPFDPYIIIGILEPAKTSTILFTVRPVEA